MEETTTEKATTPFILASLLAVGGIATGAWAGSQQPTELGFSWKDGAEVYKKVCALCHDTAIGPPILGRSHDPSFIQLIVRHGNRAMPAFRASEIDDQSLEKLAEYVSKTAVNK